VVKIAVDVVLLPSQAMMDRAIAANRRLLRIGTDKITLNKRDCLPHISLAMGCIEKTDIPNIERTLRTVAKSRPPGPLTIVGIRVGTDAAGRKVSVFEVGKTDLLQSLHEAVMRDLSPYLSSNVTADMLLGEPAADDSTLQWIRDYPEKSSFENFFPHITIGFGQIAEHAVRRRSGPARAGVPSASEGPHLPSPIEFHATQLALCHLGNHCTCRKVLASAGIPTQSCLFGKSG
jgi:2'-5' RNA ligase